MRNKYLTKISKDRGNTGIAVIVAAPFLLTFMLVLVSAQQYFDATRQAQAISSEAARIGAQPDSDVVRLTDFSVTGWKVSTKARSDAEAYVERHEGARLKSLEDEGALAVTSEVAIDVDYIFDVPGLPDAAESTSTARVLRGVEEGEIE